MRKVNIAIDGPNGVGKSTVSKNLAQRLDYTFINSGSVYRAITLNALEHNILTTDTAGVIKSLETINIELLPNDITLLDGNDISLKIRADYISKVTPTVAKIPEVRAFVVKFIQHMTLRHKGYIIDGRDTTFRILPHAEVKIFLWATPEIRAQRRYEQNKILGYNTNYQEVLKEVELRDQQDIHREVDPLHKTEDAIYIDCTELTTQEVENKIIDIVNQKLKAKKEQNA
ncbi:(d)CMP kinase [Mycoplasma sp. 21DD0573]|uniref:(d)CMP kinase n=1 Tax=unclassified Mycoplasma TaxID=2683645 RepID=UPI002B1D1005|nr:(d)CMP kinase [Mycoplasma sp. 21DD0573]MEA4276394.1 (d)CMP kinase [Mycoplasma sp. 21DD0573]